MDRVDFAEMFCEHNGCEPTETVTRIAFEYTEPHQPQRRQA